MAAPVMDQGRWEARSPRGLAAVAAVGLLAGLGTATAVSFTGVTIRDSRGAITLTLVVGLTFIGTGLFAAARRPDSRSGWLMVAIGFLWFLAATSLSSAAALFTIGLALLRMWVAVAIHLVLAFPTGRLQGRLDHVIVTVAYVAALPVRLIALLFADPDCPDCPEQLLRVASPPELGAALYTLADGLIGIAALATAVRLVIRWRHSTEPARRALGPVLLAGGLMTALAVPALVVTTLELSAAAADVLGGAVYAALVGVPFALLVGVLRSRLDRAGAVGRLSERLREVPGPAALREALAEALGDPGLAVAYWVADDGGWVDDEGRPFTLPLENPARAVTEIEVHGGRVAAIVHDAALADDPALVRAAGGAAALWLENERLKAGLQARVRELRASRARLVQAADDERRRIERDLHDGAQQRLASLLLHLQIGRRQPDRDALLEDVASGLADALEELRALAAGILPPVLADRGLGAAVDELGGRSPVAVHVESMPAQRLPDQVEVAAYFVVAEALANVVKHAGARRAMVRVLQVDGRVVVEVHDDGRGGADFDGGSGLRGLADRVGALDGSLWCRSPVGGGTLLRADIPCAY